MTIKTLETILLKEICTAMSNTQSIEKQVTFEYERMTFRKEHNITEVIPKRQWVKAFENIFSISIDITIPGKLWGSTRVFSTLHIVENKENKSYCSCELSTNFDAEPKIMAKVILFFMEIGGDV